MNAWSPTPPRFSSESYDPIVESDFRSTSDHPLSTFAADVDTASYANTRRFLRQGRLPPADAVRVEELINYFDYERVPTDGEHPLSVAVEIAECPWQPAHRLARISLFAEAVERGESAGSNLVFLLDVSGSMSMPNKLPLLQQAFTLLAQQLGASDRVAIVVYAAASGLVLPSTPGDRQREILQALDRLQAGGSTAGAAGLRLAYDVARENFIEGGVNRVILATDGDFNVGPTSHSELISMIKADADRGIFLSIFGFGMDNLKDDRLETLSGEGNGTYGYIDTIEEARKQFVDGIDGTLVTVAKDVKIQVEFNPTTVAAYRLVGYENRLMSKEQFDDDAKDAGEVGSGHSVTALYELIPPDAAVGSTAGPSVDLRYQRAATLSEAAASDETLTLRVRYKEPEGSESRLFTMSAVDDGATAMSASDDFRFAASVAAFGMLLRGSEQVTNFDCTQMIGLAEAGRGVDRHGYRGEFIELARASRKLLERGR